MEIYLLAGLITLAFTTLLTIAGVGAAFILIPLFIALGIEVHVAMATALLLNAIAMAFASYRFSRNGLILWKSAFPILLTATVLSPLGAYVSQGLNRNTLLWLFVGFLLFAAAMMFFYDPASKTTTISPSRLVVYGTATGAFAGFLGGLLGVGGGNFIVPVLVWLGIDSKKASATTAFVVIFSSLSGFLGHASLGNMSLPLLGFTAAGSVLGAVVGSWLMTDRLQPKQVKLVIGGVLVFIAANMLWGLLS